MLIVAYDFQKDKTRTRFAKFLDKFGRRIQYSIFEVKHSQRVLRNVQTEVELKYKKNFKNTDSVMVIPICEGCQKKIMRYGYSENEEKDVIVFD